LCIPPRRSVLRFGLDRDRLAAFRAFATDGRRQCSDASIIAQTLIEHARLVEQGMTFAVRIEIEQKRHNLYANLRTWLIANDAVQQKLKLGVGFSYRRGALP
jgi:hypothetical protein